MTSGVAAIPPWQTMTEEQVDRWEEVLSALAGMVPSDAARLVVDGAHSHATVADLLADRLNAAGRPCTRIACDAPVPETPGTLILADGHPGPAAGAWDVAIWLRTSQPSSEDAEHDADIVLDLHDGTWPMIRHVALRLAGGGDWYVAESRAFFAAPAQPWTPASEPPPPQEP